MPAEVVECDVLDENIVEGESARVEITTQNVGLEDDGVVADVLLDGSSVTVYFSPLLGGGESVTETITVSPSQGNYQVEVQER